MEAYSIDMLLEHVNGTVQAASAESLRVGVILGVKKVHREVGPEICCQYRENEPIEIKGGMYRIPSKVVDIDAVYRNPVSSRRGQHGFVIGNGIRSPYQLAYRKDLLELHFPNFREGTAYMGYFSLYHDEKGNILIPEVMIDACEKFCSYDMLNRSNNKSNPKWQERLIMRNDADVAIKDTRGAINRTSTDGYRTIQSF